MSQDMASHICNNAFRDMLECGLLQKHLSLREIQSLGHVNRHWRQWNKVGRPLLWQGVLSTADEKELQRFFVAALRYAAAQDFAILCRVWATKRKELSS
jgi:hypothetical protein